MSENNEKLPLPLHNENHNFSKFEGTLFTGDQHNADDIGWASTAEYIIEIIEKNC